MKWKNKIRLLCWDLDGTLYPNNLELNKHIDSLLITTIAEKHNWTQTETKEKLAEKISELKSTTKSLESFGIEGKNFSPIFGIPLI